MHYRIINQETKQVAPVFGQRLIKHYQAQEGELEQAYDGKWYLKGYAPQKPEPTPQEQIRSLEEQITERNIRNAILGDPYAINKITEIENLIANIRAKIPAQGGKQ